jgi:hypothetical protein
MRQEPKGPYRNAAHPQHKRAEGRPRGPGAAGPDHREDAGRPRGEDARAGAAKQVEKDRASSPEGQARELQKSEAYRNPKHKDHASTLARVRSLYAAAYPGRQS